MYIKTKNKVYKLKRVIICNYMGNKFGNLKRIEFVSHLKLIWTVRKKCAMT